MNPKRKRLNVNVQCPYAQKQEGGTGRLQQGVETEVLNVRGRSVWCSWLSTPFLHSVQEGGGWVHEGLAGALADVSTRVVVLQLDDIALVHGVFFVQHMFTLTFTREL